jgi:hypothetical protein
LERRIEAKEGAQKQNKHKKSTTKAKIMKLQINIDI